MKCCTAAAATLTCASNCWRCARTGAYLRHAFIAVGRVRASYEQHGELVQAILDHDPERAHRMMMRHISLAQGAKGLADFLINLPRSMVKP